MTPVAVGTTMGAPRVTGESAAAERRARERVPLRCPILLFRKGTTEPVRASSANLSSRGIYWITDVPFAPVETLRCRIMVLAAGLGYASRNLWIDCHVQVVRTEQLETGFGVGARIDNYSVFVTHQNGAA